MLRSLRQNSYKYIFAILSVLILPSISIAGQIKGTITEKKSKDPIVGATVQVLETTLGGISDFDGYYIIRNVEPGEYVIRISALGYQTVEVTEVSVTGDLTFEVNSTLSEKTSELDVIVTVRAKRDIIDKSNTAGSITIGKEVIQAKPVTTVEDLVSQIAGVVTGTGGEIYVRGGRAGEISYIVDGVPITDPLGGLGQPGAQLSLVSGSIQEFTIIKDGFDPEYGNALSGIIKISTQTGSKDNTRINYQYITDDFGNSSLNKYSRNSDFLRFSLSGPDPFFTNRILPAIGLSYLAEREFTYYFYLEATKNDGAYQYSDYDTPITRRDFGSFNLFGLDIPDRLYNKYYFMANIQFRPKPNMKVIFSYKNSRVDQTLFRWESIFTSATAPVNFSKWKTVSLEISHSINKNTNYDLILSYALNTTSEKPGDPNNPGKGLNPDQMPLDSEEETWSDDNGNGIWDPPEPIINLFPDTAVYGDGIVGPAYTFGEFNFDENLQDGLPDDSSNFRFNDNLILDMFEGEPFIDLNGNGSWDRGEYLNDKNGNGVLDYNRYPRINNRVAEPYTDGDSIIGEPFTDNNANGIYDRGIDNFIKSTGPDNMDLNHNGRYDGPDISPLEWVQGIPFVDLNANGLYDPPNQTYNQGEPFVDLNGNGKYDAGGATFLNPNNFDVTSTWHFRETKTYRAEFKIFRQLGRHELKFGAALSRDDFIFQQIDRPYTTYTGRPDSIAGIPAPYPTRGSFRDMFKYNPWGGTVYFNDKLEYGSMIASLGIRWDFFIQDKYDLVKVAQNDDLGSGKILGDRQKFSPRIGFSYPISDKAKVYFNYGHFFQLPSLRLMYSRNTSSVNSNDVVGNYNLDYQKTIQYSFGVKYAMSESYSIDFQGYFKDEFDKINSASVIIGGLIRQQYRNSDYGRGRGVEITLEKRGSGYVNGLVSYTYAFAFGKASQTNEDYLTLFELSREPLSEAALNNDVRHSLKSSIQIFVPSTVKPRMFGLPIPNGWSLGIETIVESGRPFTPDRSYPDLTSATGQDIQRNSLRKPTIVNFNVRLTKDFKMAGIDFKGIAWVDNVFDNRNVSFVYSNTGRPDTQQNQSGQILIGTPFDQNPANWNFGRQVRIGLEINI